MMKRILPYILVFLFLFIPENTSFAQYAAGSNNYVIKDFESEITLEKDTSLTVKETITVNFPYEKHGIYRVIPVNYTHRGRSINSRLKVLSVKDEKGNNYRYKREWLRQSVSLKIGDPETYVKGEKIYVISYKVYNILQEWSDGYELYWNVTGSEWDTSILNAKAVVNSGFANINKADCFAGAVGTKVKNCAAENSNNTTRFNSNVQIDTGDDFTIVVGFDRNNKLAFPGLLQRIVNITTSNWGYLAALIPFSAMFYFWWKKGRDTRYISENIYYQPSDTATREVMPFERKHIPFVYHPIDGMSPSEVGTLIDEKVDIQDVIAEILEMARLGFISVRKIERDKLFGKEVEYAFIKEDKFDNVDQRAKLNDYQDYLLKEIFRSVIIHASVKKAEDLFKNQSKELNNARKLLIKKEYVLLSALKNHFYQGLPVFKNKLYKRTKEEDLYYYDPQKTREMWVGILIALIIVSGLLIFYFLNFTNNAAPFIVLVPFSGLAFLFALNMPKRTPKGYAFYRQIEGLKWYLRKGAWRYEVSEKNLFIEEVLPLAVSLGVVNELVNDMRELGLKPPTYFAGTTVNTFASDFTGFRTTSTNAFLSTPAGRTSSGLSSWSGGSGFSGGGSSGGGFGGGGGGSW